VCECPIYQVDVGEALTRRPLFSRLKKLLKGRKKRRGLWGSAMRLRRRPATLHKEENSNVVTGGRRGKTVGRMYVSAAGLRLAPRSTEKQMGPSGRKINLYSQRADDRGYP